MNECSSSTRQLSPDEVLPVSRPETASRYRILVVDDDPGLAFLMALILKRAGYETDSALSGEDALRQLNQGHVDCVLSDISMAPMDGLELCRKVRERDPALPVILMTGSNVLIEQGRHCGALSVLRKPFDPNELLGVLSALWQKEDATDLNTGCG